MLRLAELLAEMLPSDGADDEQQDRLVADLGRVIRPRTSGSEDANEALASSSEKDALFVENGSPRFVSWRHWALMAGEVSRFYG